MKALISLLFLCSVPLVFAQEEAAEAPQPTEPPFKVGDLPLESGYTIEREGAPNLNFRIVENRMRLYWIDDEGLIMKPELPAVSVRFDKRALRPNVRTFHRLMPLSDDTALGSPYLLVVPHRYFVTLLLTPADDDTEEVESYRFQYVPAMDEVKPPETE